MSRLFVDDRYRGAHGIGRYAREVTSRLRPPFEPLALDGSPYSPIDSLRALPTLAKTDLVYSPGYGALVRAPRQIVTIHDLIQLRSPWPGRAKFAVYYGGPVRRVVRKAGVVLTVSETSARDIREWVRDESVRVVNAGNGSSAAFRPEGVTAESDAPYIFYVGNTRHHKNFEVVVTALAFAPDVHLRAVLPPQEVAIAQAWAEAAGVSNRVEWISGADDERLAQLYRGAVATVQPSTDEGFGLPALESIACATPVIFWRGCESVAEIVGDRGWGLDEAKDARAWGEAFVAAAGAGRRVTLPAGLYDWDRTAEIISSELERALAL